MQRTRSHSSFLFLLPLALAAVLLVGCAQEVRVVGGEDGVTLREIKVPFSGLSKMGDIEGDPYRYFKYSSPEEAEEDKAKVSADGQEIDGVRYEWGGPVHFYHFAKSLIIYVGENEQTLGQIQRTFGLQFAGE